MVHGGHARRRFADRRRPLSRPSRAPGLDRKKMKKPKSVSIKNQIRSTERMLRKELPSEVREAQEKKLKQLKELQEAHVQEALKQRLFLRDRKIKFFERRKIERRLRRLEKQQRAPSDNISEETVAEQLVKLKEDLEYVRFFPKTERYVSLFGVGRDSAEVVKKRDALQKKIKENLIAAAANGKDLEETGSDDDEHLDMSEDDFFASGSSSDEADADDEWTDKSAREPASSASGKVTSGSDEKNQRQISDRARMPPPQSTRNSFRSSAHGQARQSSRNHSREKHVFSTSSNTSNSTSGPSRTRSSNMRQDHSSNLSSNSDARKPRRKRRPKKKKQAA